MEMKYHKLLMTLTGATCYFVVDTESVQYELCWHITTVNRNLKLINSNSSGLQFLKFSELELIIGCFCNLNVRHCWDLLTSSNGHLCQICDENFSFCL